MALVLDGSTQAATLALSGLNVETEEWAIFAWVKRDPGELSGFAFGMSRSTSFRRLTGVSVRDVSGAVISAHANNGSDSYLGTTAIAEDTWLPVYRSRDVAAGSPSNQTINVNGTSTSGSIVSNTPVDTICIGANYSSAALESFFDGKVCHFAIWKGSRPGSTSITQLMAGVRPDLVVDAPTEYHALVSSLGSFTGIGSPTFDSDDPITPAGPEITAVNGDNTVSDASSGNTVTTSLGLDSVSAIVIRDAGLNETAGSSIAGSGTSWTFSTPAIADRPSAYYGSATLVLTGVYDSGPVELEFPITFNQPSGLDLTTLAADPNTSDQAVGYGIITIAEGGQYAVDPTKAVVFTDALGYTIGDQSAQIAYVYDGQMTVFTLLTGSEASAGGFTAQGFTSQGFTAQGFTSRGFA